MTIINGISLPFLIIITNFFAIAYINRSSKFIKIHQKRAKKIIKIYAQEIYKIDKSFHRPKSSILGGRRNTHILIHTILILIALIPFYQYIKETI
jgi:hypothetical protein